MPTTMPQSEMEAKLEMSLEALGLDARVTNMLVKKGILNVNDLLHQTRADLMTISNFGEKCWDQVEKKLAAIGFFVNGTKKQISTVVPEVQDKSA